MFFTSGPITVETKGTPAGGSVVSSATLQTLNTSQQEALTAASVSATCQATKNGVTGSTTFSEGRLLTDSGWDENDNGNFTDPGDHPEVAVDIPPNPEPNTSFEGHLHVNNQQDNFRYVLNEQITNPDGSITVNAIHQYLLGPTAVGELIIGQVVCGARP